MLRIMFKGLFPDPAPGDSGSEGQEKNLRMTFNKFCHMILVIMEVSETPLWSLVPDEGMRQTPSRGFPGHLRYGPRKGWFEGPQ